MPETSSTEISGERQKFGSLMYVASPVIVIPDDDEDYFLIGSAYGSSRSFMERVHFEDLDVWFRDHWKLAEEVYYERAAREEKNRRALDEIPEEVLGQIKIEEIEL